jgi:hypothetical protein
MEGEQSGDRRNAGVISCNSGDGTDQTTQSLTFMMMMMMMIYGRRLYRWELNCLDLVSSGWNGGFRHKGVVPFCTTAGKFSRNLSSNTICTNFFFYRFSFLYIVLFHSLNYALFPAQSFISFGVLSTYRNPILLHAVAWLVCIYYKMK